MFGARSAMVSMTASPKASRWSSQVPLGELVRRVLDEAADDVLAGRRHGRVDQGRDDHVDVGAPAEAAGLGVVVGPLHVVERGAEADGAAQVLALTGQAGEVGQPVEGQVDLARRAAEPEALDLGLELGLERARLQEVAGTCAGVGRGEHRRGGDLLAALEHDAGGATAAWSGCARPAPRSGSPRPASAPRRRSPRSRRRCRPWGCPRRGRRRRSRPCSGAAARRRCPATGRPGRCR